MECFVKKLVDQLHIDQDLLPNILISLTEAVNNAMIHGNRMDLRKKILVTCFEQENMVRFCISDEGNGFDPVSVPDPTKAERIEKEGGRGVFLMRQLSDDIAFLDHGRTVQLMWKI